MSLMRFALVRRGCEHCREAMRAINKVNLHLPIDKKIQIKDNFEWEEFGFKTHPVIDKLDPKTFDGYPFIYIDGVDVQPGYVESMVIVISKLVEDDLTFPITVGEKTIG